MVNTWELKIRQSGSVICPICYNRINWSYKMEAFPMADGRLVSDFVAEPHPRLVSYYFNSDGKVIFRIGCEQCRSVIETEPMELKNE